MKHKSHICVVCPSTSYSAASSSPYCGAPRCTVSGSLVPPKAGGGNNDPLTETSTSDAKVRFMLYQCFHTIFFQFTRDKTFMMNTNWFNSQKYIWLLKSRASLLPRGFLWEPSRTVYTSVDETTILQVHFPLENASDPKSFCSQRLSFVKRSQERL